MLLLLLFCMVIGGSSLYAITLLRETTFAQINAYEYQTRPAAHIAVQTLQCRRYEKDMFLNLADSQRFEEYLDRWSVSVDALSHVLTEFREHTVDSQQILDAEKWLAYLDAYQKAVHQVVEEIRAQRITTPAQANGAMTHGKDTIRTLILNSFSKFDHEFAVAQINQQNFYHQAGHLQNMITVVLLLIIIVSVMALILIPNRIVQPLRKLEQATRQLGDGDLTTRFSKDMPDNEIGRLGTMFNQMAEHIQEREIQLNDARREAESHNLAKTTFLMNMSHELRTPLTSIIGFADLLDEPELCDESIVAIQRSGQHLLRIVDDLLQLTEIETHQFQLSPCQVTIGDLISELVEELKPSADDKDLQLIMPDDEQMQFVVETDPLRLKGVLHHLMENAIKFTERGHVIVRCDQTDDKSTLLLEIKDTGMGMTVQQINRAGELFVMGDSSLTRVRGGLGTGLALCKRVLEYMQGSLHILSQPGIGTSVTVTLPMQIDMQKLEVHLPSAVAKDTSIARPTRAANGRNHVLVVEDTPEIQKLIHSLLRQIGIHVDLADNGQIALEMAMRSHINEHPYDLIIMDMQMPVLDGYAATRQLRLQGYQYPIVALTAHAMIGDRQKCLDAGCDDYMIKPIDPAMFIRYVRHWLEHPLIRVI